MLRYFICQFTCRWEYRARRASHTACGLTYYAMVMSAITTSVYYTTTSRTTTTAPVTTGATTILTTTMNTSCVYSHYHNNPVTLDTCDTDLGPTRCKWPRLSTNSTYVLATGNDAEPGSYLL